MVLMMLGAAEPNAAKSMLIDKVSEILPPHSQQTQKELLHT